MTNGMSWKECVDQNIIIETQPDDERSKQMFEMADLRLEFWDKD
jgi:hypothetical protein